MSKMDGSMLFLHDIRWALPSLLLHLDRLSQPGLLDSPRGCISSNIHGLLETFNFCLRR